MKDRHARCRQGLKRLGSQALNGGGIVQSEPDGAGIAFVHAVGLFFDTEKIGCGMQTGHADEKRASMAAEVDLQRRSRWNEPSRRNGVLVFRCGHEARCL